MKKTFLTAALIAATVTGVNTDTPKATLDIVQKDQTVKGKGFRLDDGDQTNGYVLTSDADGIGTWRMPAGGTKFGFNTIRSGVEQIYACPTQGVSSINQIEDVIVFSDYYIDLEPGVWRIDFLIPMQVQNPEVFTQPTSMVEMVLCLTTITNPSNFTEAMNSIGGGNGYRNFAPIPIYASNAAFINRGGGMVIINLTHTTQKTRYYVAVGRASVVHCADIVNIDVMVASRVQCVSATYTPEFTN
jgi:hypothetical protein